MEIRIAKIKDAIEIQKIYSYYVENTNITFEYITPNIEEMKARIKNTLQKYPYLVCIIDNRIVGYAYASSMRSRKAYDWCCELSVYVDKDFQHQGIAKQLYIKLIDILKIMNIQTLYACITFPNEVSVSFHHSFGFETIGQFHRCGYKFDKWHDMIWMEKAIGNYGVVEEIIPFSLINIENTK